MPAAPKLLPALLGGLFIGVLSSLPIVSMGNACCCLWVVSGGVLAAWMMQQNTPRPVTSGEGAIVGLMAGCLGAVLMLMVMLALARAPIDFNQILHEAAQSPEMTPEGREALENLNPAVLIAVIGMGLFLIYAVMATLGGLLGAAIFKKKQPPAPPMPPPPMSFNPPVFSPPSPMAPPPPMGPPPSPPPPPTPMTGAPLSGGTIGGPSAGWANTPAPPAPEPPEPYAGDAPTMLIPSRGQTLPPPPVPAPPSGATPPQPPPPPPPPDREPDSN